MVDISNEIKGSLSSNNNNQKNQQEIQQESNDIEEEDEDLIWSPPLSNQQINQISFLREFYMKKMKLEI